jgi:hypothetical protein
MHVVNGQVAWFDGSRTEVAATTAIEQCSAIRIRTRAHRTQSRRYALLTVEPCMPLDGSVSIQVQGGGRCDGAVDVGCDAAMPSRRERVTKGG